MAFRLLLINERDGRDGQDLRDSKVWVLPNTMLPPVPLFAHVSRVKWAAAIPVHPGFTIHSSIPPHSVCHRFRWRDYSPSPNTPSLAAGTKARRTLHSLGEGG